jgi:hypothetical protein
LTAEAADGSDGQPTEENNPKQSASAREALGRFGAYTAPALLAMLVAEKAVAASAAPD